MTCGTLRVDVRAHLSDLAVILMHDVWFIFFNAFAFIT